MEPDIALVLFALLSAPTQDGAPSPFDLPEWERLSSARQERLRTAAEELVALGMAAQLQRSRGEPPPQAEVREVEPSATAPALPPPGTRWRAVVQPVADGDSWAEPLGNLPPAADVRALAAEMARAMANGGGVVVELDDGSILVRSMQDVRSVTLLEVGPAPDAQ